MRLAAPLLELLERLERLAGDAGASRACLVDLALGLLRLDGRIAEPHRRGLAVAVGLHQQRRRAAGAPQALLRGAVRGERALGRGVRGAGRRHAVGQHAHRGVLVLPTDVLDALEVEAESLHGAKRTKAGPPSWAAPAIRSH